MDHRIDLKALEAGDLREPFQDTIETYPLSEFVDDLKGTTHKEPEIGHQGSDHTVQSTRRIGPEHEPQVHAHHSQVQPEGNRTSLTGLGPGTTLFSLVKTMSLGSLRHTWRAARTAPVDLAQRHLGVCSTRLIQTPTSVSWHFAPALLSLSLSLSLTPLRGLYFSPFRAFWDQFKSNSVGFQCFCVSGTLSGRVCKNNITF